MSIWHDTNGSIADRMVGNRLLDISGNWLFELGRPDLQFIGKLEA